MAGGPDPKTGENVAGSVKLSGERSVGIFTSTPNTPSEPNNSLRLVPDGTGTPGKLVQDPAPVGTVKAASVSLYGCGSIDLQSQYSNTNFTGVSSGDNGGTTIQGGDQAALAEVTTLATGGTQQDAVQNANQTLWDDSFSEDQDGDEIIDVPAETPK
jgi:hypothetical protein